MDCPIVLVVDDEASHVDMARVILEREWEVITANSGVEALARAAVHSPSVVLADHRMPGMTGIEMLTRLRKRDPDCVRILLTAYTNSDLLQEAINDAAVYRFFSKPCEPEILRLGVRRAMEHRAAQLELRRTRDLALVGGVARQIAHDLANCLVPVVTAPDLLREADEATAEKVLRALESSASALSALSTELRALARGEKPAYHRQKGSIVDVVENAVSICRGFPLEHRQLLLDVESGLPDIKLAPSRVLRLVVNLVTNAVDATGPRGTILVVLRRDGPGGLALEVKDDGTGVPEGDLDRIFEPGFTRKGPYGSGLGLAICRMVANGHGGEIRCHRRPTGGTQFVVHFPLRG